MYAVQIPTMMVGTTWKNDAKRPWDAETHDENDDEKEDEGRRASEGSLSGREGLDTFVLSARSYDDWSFHNLRSRGCFAYHFDRTPLDKSTQ
jgi:hypothetical protein